MQLRMRNKLVPSSMKAHARVMTKTSIIIYEPMNELPVIGSVLYSQRVLGSPGGQTLQVAVRKCMVETYWTSQKNDFEERLTIFSTQFYQKSIWARGNCKFLFG